MSGIIVDVGVWHMKLDSFVNSPFFEIYVTARIICWRQYSENREREVEKKSCDI